MASQLPERPFASLEEFHQWQLAVFEIMFSSTRSSVVVVAAALDYCAKEKLAHPEWLARAAPDALCNTLCDSAPKKRGRASSPVARFRQDMIDYARWSAVMEVREQQVAIHEQVGELRSLQNVQRDVLAEREKMLDWVGHTLQRAFECASMILDGTECFGSPDAMKKSYFAVRRNSRDPKQSMRYHSRDPRFLRKIGINPRLDEQRVTKFVPFFDLTLRR